MRRKTLAFVMSFWAGVLCMAAAYSLLWNGGKPELFLELAPSQTGERIAIRFTNIGKRVVKLDLSDLNCFLYIPKIESRVCFVQIRTGETTGKQASSEKTYTSLRPKEQIEIGDIHPLLAGLSPGRALVGGIYTASPAVWQRDVWSGVLRSLPLILDVQ